MEAHTNYKTLLLLEYILQSSEQCGSERNSQHQQFLVRSFQEQNNREIDMYGRGHLKIYIQRENVQAH